MVFGKRMKHAWKCYYEERDLIYDLQHTRNNVRDTADQIRNGEMFDITHLSRMFLELYEKVGELCDCPVCFNEMTKDNTFVALCGHLICKTCRGRLIKCPLCKKNYS